MREIRIGGQDFAAIREGNFFYIDKTFFIREWWEAGDDVTLITRPRRFGKTLNMNMLKCFFSQQYAGRKDLFEGLDIWEEAKYRQLQGTYPVIFLSFADIKERSFPEARRSMVRTLQALFDEFRPVWEKDADKAGVRYVFMDMSPDTPDSDIARSIQQLSSYLKDACGKKVLIILDEYDTPLQEAFVNGYCDEMSAFIRSLFNSTFKTNPALERAVMTGITRVSKESIFSDLNNLKVITTTSRQYETYFGFTQKEVTDALEEFGLSGRREQVKEWYDGFTFGDTTDIYNPWSILNYLDTGEFAPYWANTSSNALISYELRISDNSIKTQMEALMDGGSVSSIVDEQIIYSQLDEDAEAIWSLFLAGGYLKVLARMFDGRRYHYTMALTNLEVEIMFEDLIIGWFRPAGSSNDNFIKSMIIGDVDQMNLYMNQITMMTFSSFDVGSRPSVSSPPEKFYHGFVLGLLVRESADYRIKSNKESGFGRYDICMFPKQQALPGIVIEFKVQDPGAGEKELSQTADAALRQIIEKNYAAELQAEGVRKILQYGFAFAGKRVLIKKCAMEPGHLAHF